MSNNYLHLEPGVIYAGLEGNNPEGDAWNEYECHEYVASDKLGHIQHGCGCLGILGTTKPITKVRLAEALIALGKAKKFQAEYAEAVHNLERLIAKEIA